ncbi:hypothetical protein LDENG_00115280 [Lucifuga dentata]|nr:hypothetical protein LDENG_00115280 [Lucifuga dentata]
MSCEHPPGGNCAFDGLKERQFPSPLHRSFVAAFAPRSTVHSPKSSVATQRTDGHGHTPGITDGLAHT